ncbi:MAG: energy transducer TonB [Bacteroidia bacterium]
MKHTLLISVSLLFGYINLFGQVDTDKTNAQKDTSSFIYAEKEPTLLNMNVVVAKIDYPKIARDAGIEGIVIARVLVDEYGNYEKHKYVQKIHPILVTSIDTHIAELKFTPAISEGKPIKFWVNIPFEFKLLEEKKKRRRKR